MCMAVFVALFRLQRSVSAPLLSSVSHLTDRGSCRTDLHLVDTPSLLLPPLPIHPPPEQDVVASWAAYSEGVQQDVFTALQMPVAGGDWDQLEGRLQVALDLASLF